MTERTCKNKNSHEKCVPKQGYEQQEQEQLDILAQIYSVRGEIEFRVTVPTK